MAATQGATEAGRWSAAAAPAPTSALDRRAASTRSPCVHARQDRGQHRLRRVGIKAGKPRRLPSTRSTFQAGRVSPSGRTTAWKLCRRPSAFTNEPDVSLNGAIGNSTSLMSMLVLKGLERHHHAGRVQTGHACCAVCGRLGVEQDQRLERLAQHLAGVQTALPLARRAPVAHPRCWPLRSDSPR